MTAERFSDRMRGEIPYNLLHVPVRDIRDGQQISQCFLVRQKTQRSTRSGDPYLELVLADRTGSIAGRAWSEAAQRYATQFDEGEFVYVEARSETYRNNLQLIVSSIRRMTAHEQESGKLPGFDPALLVPASERDIDEMWGELVALIETIEPEPLRQLTEAIVTERESALREFPAAVAKHHAYLGGLLEHTLEVAQPAAAFVDQQPAFNLHRGLMVAGSILHDIGKLEELENPIAANYTFAGQLTGHLLLGRDMVRREAERLTWPDPRLPELLEHILVSHHGELEYAAAMVPKTPEAIAIYHFDNLSAKLNMVRTHIAADGEDGDFTDWERTLERRFFKGRLQGE